MYIHDFKTPAEENSRPQRVEPVIRESAALAIYRSPGEIGDRSTYIRRNAQIGFTSRGFIDVRAAIAERNPIRRAIMESKSSSDAS